MSFALLKEEGERGREVPVDFEAPEMTPENASDQSHDLSSA